MVHYKSAQLRPPFEVTDLILLRHRRSDLATRNVADVLDRICKNLVDQDGHQHCVDFTLAMTICLWAGSGRGPDFGSTAGRPRQTEAGGRDEVRGQAFHSASYSATNFDCATISLTQSIPAAPRRRDHQADCCTGTMAASFIIR